MSVVVIAAASASSGGGGVFNSGLRGHRHTYRRARIARSIQARRAAANARADIHASPHEPHTLLVPRRQTRGPITFLKKFWDEIRAYWMGPPVHEKLKEVSKNEQRTRAMNPISEIA
ncbi:hypothetical protein SISNIDRAFT_498591 [Sistotremastrum niveocremeum HHB9708]|uniref:Uncharacterized protein n=2 Tax=Sistotremastraceae TaxID=3402574 RepID=A0A164MWW9_9AGAM|nr:hypothetical protein SISNIDRAFT_498591 [Sistotremastrum niveocremeum HHB9708]KZT32801.1 hypothetical protein SISSUDRAFT_1123215 [Sistotremastrum suecicum HHB10207 ss-3]